jgi:hypothetical protein
MLRAASEPDFVPESDFFLTAMMEMEGRDDVPGKREA